MASAMHRRRLLRGHVVDPGGAPVAGAVVEVLNPTALSPEVLGELVTDDEGAYELALGPIADERFMDREPDVEVVVYDATGVRPLARVGPFLLSSLTGPEVPAAIVPRGSVRGWLARHDDGEVVRLSRGNRIEYLVDGEESFARMADMVARARRTVHLVQLTFEPDFVATWREGRQAISEDEEDEDPFVPETRMAHALTEAADRGVDVRVLMNENLALPDHVDEVEERLSTEEVDEDEGTDVASARARENLEVRPFFRTPAVMHAKMLVVDGTEAVVIGPPFEQKFWDTHHHRVRDPRRHRKEGLHDVSIHVRGPAVADIAQAFADLWNLSRHRSGKNGGGEAGAGRPRGHFWELDIMGLLSGGSRKAPEEDETDAAEADADEEEGSEADAADEEQEEEEREETAPLLEAPPPPPQAGDQALQVLLTVPEDVFPGAPRPETSILDGYERAISNATDLIYIEVQYFTNQRVTRLLRRALARRPDLHLILVLNEDVDIPTYIAKQQRRLAELGYPDHPRVGVFKLESFDRRDEDVDEDTDIDDVGGIAMRNYVHGKVALVDDKWATLGCANVDDTGLEAARPLGFKVQPNEEVNVAVLDGVDGLPATGAVRDLRLRLWSEHLGVDAAYLAHLSGAEALGLWRWVAAANREAVSANRPADFRGHVVPYAPVNPLSRFVSVLTGTG